MAAAFPIGVRIWAAGGADRTGAAARVGTLYAINVAGAGGLMLQWIGHREEMHYKMIARTFLRVFPDATVWVDGSLLVGTLAPLELRPETLARKLADPEVRAAVSSVGIADVESVLRLYTAGPEEIRRLVGDGPELTDDQPLLEYHRSLPRNAGMIDLSVLRGDVSRILPRPSNQ
jgi:hypothetical protein